LRLLGAFAIRQFSRREINEKPDFVEEKMNLCFGLCNSGGNMETWRLQFSVRRTLNTDRLNTNFISHKQMGSLLV
jgi:hypothetical protein